jgi:hypothetical protein
MLHFESDNADGKLAYDYQHGSGDECGAVWDMMLV